MRRSRRAALTALRRTLTADDVPRREARVRARRQAAHRQLRRPRVEPRRQRRRATKRSATASATSATLMVPCPWAREAAARYRGEDVGVHLTLNAEYDLYRWGPITHAPVAARRRRRLPAHGRGRVGPRRPRRGAAGAAGPGRAGDLLGLRRQPSRLAHGHAAAATRVLRRVPRAGRRLRPAAPAARARRRRRLIGFPFRRLRGRGGRGVPRPLRLVRAASGAGAGSSGCCATCDPGSPRSTSTRRSTPPSCGRSRRTGRRGSTTTTS